MESDIAITPALNWLPGEPLPWSAKVSKNFIDLVFQISNNLAMPTMGPVWLMGCMAWESNATFSPSIRNMAGSGAVGLIQFMPATAVDLGTSTDLLAKMTAEQQLVFVQKYFSRYAGRLKSLGDVYMAILWPAAIGKPDDHILWSQESRPTTYRQNAGLDVDKDGAITKAECTAKVYARLMEGFKPENMRV
ncbi:lytic transglycosylase domain-containing protein [Staphylococcus aureus]|uniref:lytic transglycosylase domain-containing protein n=1 Tax=Staphylococcus aureus TaxID=1280 RepID=UPI0012A240E2|nr:lytic transglycosylase domain-containing protein [Staphylococcus aureus]AYD82576.1 putative D-alanyl-D-alanin carboxypeptidase [Achromobacter phage vB_Ade_ART]MBD4207878.1 lytic transglycosylase [Xanthomonas citri pv. citri]